MADGTGAESWVNEDADDGSSGGEEEEVMDTTDGFTPEDALSLANLIGGNERLAALLTPAQATCLLDQLTQVDITEQSSEDAAKLLQQQLQQLSNLLKQKLEPADEIDGGTVQLTAEDATDGVGEGEAKIDLDSLNDDQTRMLNGLAHIDLSVILKKHGVNKVTCHRWKKNTKAGDKGAFGVPLSQLLELDRARSPDNRCVPLIVEQLVDYVRQHGLEQEGIFRQAGVRSRILSLRQQINLQNQFVVGDQETVSAYDVADVLKNLIRDLPSPLLTLKGEFCRSSVNPIQLFSQVNTLSDEGEKLRAYNLLMLMLPAVNRNTLKLLLNLMADVVANVDRNRMDLRAISVVMAPTLFLSSYGRKNMSREVSTENESATDSVAFLIEHQNQLWEIPKSLERQMNQVMAAEQTKLTEQREAGAAFML